MKFIKGLFGGLFIGAIVALGLFALAYILEFADCLLLCGCGSQFTQCADANYLDPSYVFWGCGDSNCDGPFGQPQGLFPIWNMTYFINTIIFCTIAGAIIGLIYGITKQVQEIKENIKIRNRAVEARLKAEEEKRRRDEQARKDAEKNKLRGYASDFKRKSEDVIKQCENHKRTVEGNELRPQYEATSLQGDIWSAVNDTSTSLQKLKDITTEIAVIKEDK